MNQAPVPGSPKSPGAVPPAAPPAKKSSCLKWVLGCGCGCLLLSALSAGVVYFFMRETWYSVQNQYRASVERGGRYEIRQRHADGMYTFVNSPNKLDGELAANFVDFSFNYPKHWAFDPTSGVLNARNFAKVGYVKDGLPHESIAFSPFIGKFDDNEQLGRAIKGMVNVAADVKISGAGPRKFGKYEAYEIKYGKNFGDRQWWLRAIAVKNDGNKPGIFVMMSATPAVTGVKGVEDVGVEGELPEIINSFEFK